MRPPGHSGKRPLVSPPQAPFVLLDDARDRGASPARLYAAPVEIVSTRDPGQVLACLDRLRSATAHGLHIAGFLSYEAGAAFEPSLGPPPAPDLPLLWFGVFESFEQIAPEDVAALLPDPAGAWLGSPHPRIDRGAYDAKLARILDLIAAGDIYQANLTFRADVPHAGDPLALYAGLRQRARAGYGGVVWTGENWAPIGLTRTLLHARRRGTDRQTDEGHRAHRRCGCRTGE